MFTSSQLFLALAFSFNFIVDAKEDLINSLDDKLGREYVAKEDVDKAKQQMKDTGFGFGSDWITMPNGDGSPVIALLTPPEINENNRFFYSEILEDNTPVTEGVTFTLYTRLNSRKGKALRIKGINSLGFDPSKPTKIIVHGWQSSGNSSVVTSIRDAYLKSSDANVIGVDWSKSAGNFYYPAAASYTKKVGRYIAELVDMLVETQNARYEDFHLIGHSLGAHTMGVAGHHTKKRVARITGLDPALPCFQDKAAPPDMLDKSDADFVQVIHTCSGALGMSSPAGHADFYPNGGTPFQPGCCCKDELFACSHGRSIIYFAESILKNQSLTAKKCPTWENFKKNTCSDGTIPMGEFTPTSARGIFYLQTSSEPPYGLGTKGVLFNA